MTQTTIGLSTQTLVSRNQAAKAPQYVAALAATLGGFVMGTILGWTSPCERGLTKNTEYIGRNLTSDEFSLIGGFAPIGAMFGSLLTGPISDKFGRRRTMITLLIPACIGWALIIWASSVPMMYVGRFILGFVAGATSVVGPLYTTEIAQVEVRGTLGTYFQLQVTIGIFFTYILGCVNISVYWISVACFIIPFIYAAVMIFMPESPHYFIQYNKETEAKKALQWLRGKNFDVTAEMDTIRNTIEEVKSQKISLSQAFTSRAAKIGLVIGLGTMFFQQFSGINAVVFYSSTIFSEAGSSLPPEISTLIIGAVMVVATFVSTLIIDRLGRKPLLFGSDLIMAISSGVLGVYFYLMNHNYKGPNISWLPLLCITLFVIVFSLGFGPIPWMFMSEIFPPEIKGPACSVASLFNWLCAFIVTKFFSTIKEKVGSDYTFWGFTVISAVGCLFVAFLLPETKGKSLDDIQRILGGKNNRSQKSVTIESGAKSKY